MVLLLSVPVQSFECLKGTIAIGVMVIMILEGSIAMMCGSEFGSVQGQKPWPPENSIYFGLGIVSKS